MTSTYPSATTAFPALTDLNRARAIRVIAWVLLVPGLLAVGGGGLMVLGDLADTTDYWHGLGVWIGVFVALPGAIVAAAALVVLLAVRATLRSPAAQALSRLTQVRAVLTLVAVLGGLFSVLLLSAAGITLLAIEIVFVIVPVALIVVLLSAWVSDLADRLD